MLKKIVFIFWLSCFTHPIFAFEGFDECREFKSQLQKNIKNFSFKDEFPWETEDSFGFVFSSGFFALRDLFEPDDEKLVPSRLDNLHSDLLSELGDDPDAKLFDLMWNAITSINGQDYFSIDYSSFEEMSSGESIKIQVEESDKIYEFKKKSYKVVDVFFDPFVNTIYEIDAKNSSFSASVQFNTYWFDERFLELGRSVYKKGLEFDREYEDRVLKEDPLASFGFNCTIQQEFLDELNLSFPDVQIADFRSDNEMETPIFSFEYITNHNGKSIHDNVLNPYEKLTSLIDGDEGFAVTKSVLYQGRFQNDFQLSKFPFDRQRLTFPIVPVDGPHMLDGTIRISPGAFADEAMDTSFQSLLNNEWQINNYDYGENLRFSNIALSNIPYFEFWFELERNVEYYIYKLMLPIVLLLALTWSIFWIAPQNLETRVTISIVTFLALVAYNFVIDSDLPKLSYLTFLDCVILVSYFFAGVPTFVAIYCDRKASVGNGARSLQVNSLSKIIFPVGYLLSLAFVMLAFDVSW